MHIILCIMPQESWVHMKTLCPFCLLLQLSSSMPEASRYGTPSVLLAWKMVIPPHQTLDPPLWGAWRKFDCSISCISARRSSILKVWGARDTSGAFWSWRNSATNCQKKDDKRTQQETEPGEWGTITSNTRKEKPRNYKFGNTQIIHKKKKKKTSRRNKANLTWSRRPKGWNIGEPGLK